jgi:tight adherence protein B
MLSGAEKSLEKSARWAKFRETLEIAMIRVPALQIVLWTIAATAAAMLLFTLIGGSPFFAVFALFVPLAVRGFIKSRLTKQRRRFEEQLADNLQVMSSALRAGHSFIGALAVVVEDSAEPSKTEFQRVIQDEQLGVPLEEGLEVVVRRMQNRDLEQVAVVASLQRHTGGNTAEVLDRVTETVRERGELRRLVRTLTAQGRLSRWVVSFLPVGVLIMLTIINPGFTEPLFTELVGRIMLAVAATMVVIGSLVIKKIIEIEV